MQVPGRKQDIECHHNTKQKIYPDGSTKITVCSRDIFCEPDYKAVEHLQKKRPDTELQKIITECFDLGIEVDYVKNEPEKNDDKSNDNIVRNDNVRRAKEKIFDIALLNDFEYFVTWTLNKEKIDRYNADEISEKLKIFLSNMKSRHGLKYLVVPERHKDGAIHMHGLISGNMEFIDSGTRIVPNEKKPVGKRKMRQLGYNETSDGVHIVYNMPQWTMGYSTAIKTYGQSKNTAKYMTKYVTKALSFKKIFGNFYYAGGKITRNAPTIVYDTDYEKVNEKEYYIQSAQCGFKYIDTVG